jgi:hypothetical protein
MAEVALSRRHNEIRGAVSVDGELALEAVLEEPEPIAGADIELFDNLHLVNLTEGGQDGEPLLVQVDPGYQYHDADRGPVRLGTYRPTTLGVDGIEPVYAVVGVTCRADMELTAPRFVIDPRVPAVQGTRRL